MSISPLARRGLRVVLAPTLGAVLALGSVPVLTGPAHAVGSPDPRPARVGADWLAGQLTDGVLYNTQYAYDDFGLSIDAALALDAVGGQDAAVDAVTDAVAANLGTYVSGGDPDELYSGPLAKVLTLATDQGRNARSFGGSNLVTDLEGRVLGAGANTGRIEDRSQYGDYANTIGQSFAARGLTVAQSARADEATDFLLAQQCAAGFFRLSFAAQSAPGQGCDDDPASAPSVDVTALAVVNLSAQSASSVQGGVPDAIDRAAEWLLSVQGAAGAFSGSPPTDGRNTNSTGLAAWALAEAGRSDASALSAGWVRAHQADQAPRCQRGLTGQQGAVAYDDDALRRGRGDGITEETSDQWRRATAQALPGLLRAERGTGTALRLPRGYVRGGARITARVTGAGPGEALCVVRGRTTTLRTADRTGATSARITLARGTGTYRVRVQSGRGTEARAFVDALGRQQLDPRLAKARVGRGGTQVVRVGHLAAGESVRVRYRGSVVAAKNATARGNVKLTFRVTGKPGLVRVRVLGEFADIRRGSDTFRVRR